MSELCFISILFGVFSFLCTALLFAACGEDKLSSDRDKIDTTNDYGVFYRVVYKASLEGDELTACGSMDYRNSRDQDPITISSDIAHVFKVDDNTVYLKDGEEGTEVEISGGVVATAILSAQ